jgi:uncharacterized membrane protein
MVPRVADRLRRPPRVRLWPQGWQTQRLEELSLRAAVLLFTVDDEGTRGVLGREGPVIELLGTAVSMGSGIVAGVFFAVAVSVLPTVQTQPADQYRNVHRKSGEGYHPVMPLVVIEGAVADLVLIFVTDGGTVRALFGVALLAMGGVQIISQFGNATINNRVHALDPADTPADLQDPRRPWRSSHRLRTAFALTALAVIALAVALLS